MLLKEFGREIGGPVVLVLLVLLSIFNIECAVKAYPGVVPWADLLLDPLTLLYDPLVQKLGYTIVLAGIALEWSGLFFVSRLRTPFPRLSPILRGVGPRDYFNATVNFLVLTFLFFNVFFFLSLVSEFPVSTVFQRRQLGEVDFWHLRFYDSANTEVQPMFVIGSELVRTIFGRTLLSNTVVACCITAVGTTFFVLAWRLLFGPTAAIVGSLLILTNPFVSSVAASGHALSTSLLVVGAGSYLCAHLLRLGRLRWFEYSWLNIQLVCCFIGLYIWLALYCYRASLPVSAPLLKAFYNQLIPNGPEISYSWQIEPLRPLSHHFQIPALQSGFHKR